MATGYLRYPHVHGDLITFVAGDDVLARARRGRPGLAAVRRRDPGQLPALLPGRHPDRVDRLAGRPARGLRRRPRGRRRGPAHLLGRPADPRRRLDGGRRGARRHLGRPAGHEIPQGLRDPRPRRRPAPAPPVRAGQRPGHRGRRHRAADRQRGRRARVLEALPRRPGRKLWVATGDDPLFTRVLTDLGGQLASPMLIGGRLFFLSDHEGTGNIYSCALDGTDLARHTDHDGAYARNPSTDGRRIVYHVAGDIWMLDDPDAAGPHRVEITLGAPAAARTPRLISAADHLGDLDCDRTGQASVVEVRGTVHWLTHKDGPARALHVDPDARARLPRVLGETGKVVWVTDAAGPDALEVASVTGDAPTVRLAEGALGFVLEPRPRPGRNGRGGRLPRRPAAARRPRPQFLRAGHRADRLGQRRHQRAVLVAGLGLAGLVRARAVAVAAPAPGQSGRPADRRGDRWPVLRQRPGLHRRRPLPGLPVRAQLRPGLRRAVLRPVVPVRQPPVPGPARGDHPVAVRATARRRPVAGRMAARMAARMAVEPGTRTASRPSRPP